MKLVGFEWSMKWYLAPTLWLSQHPYISAAEIEEWQHETSLSVNWDLKPVDAEVNI